MNKQQRAFVAVTFLCLSACASYTEFTWCGEGADNNWSTKKNWVGGTAPGGWDYAVFPPGDWTVNIPEGKSISQLGIRLEDGTGTVTFTGTGSLPTCNFAGSAANPPPHIIVPEGRTLIVDGPAIASRKYDQRGVVRIKSGSVRFTSSSALISKIISGDAKLFLEGGDFTSDNGCYLYVSNRAEVVVSVGDFSLEKGVMFNNDSHFLMTGGRYVATYPYYTIYTFEGNSTCDIFGGTVRWMTSDGSSAYMAAREFRKMAPKKGGTLVFPSPLSDAVDLSTTSGTYAFAGEVYVTNRTSATSGGFRTQSYAGLTGGGTLYANYLNLNPPSNDNRSEWDLGALYLGAGGISHNDHSGVNYNFRDGLLLGAFADWSFFNGPNYSFYFNFFGPLTFDTANCFDETDEATGEVLKHAITGNHVKFAGVTDFEAKGGGTVALGLVDAPEQLRSIDIGAGTTVAFTNCTVKLKAMNLRLGAGATLAVDLSSGSYVDAAAVAEFGAGAKIVVTKLPATLKAGKVYPILFAPAKKGEAEFLPTIELPEDTPAGWFVGTTANSFYLTDGTCAPGSETTDTKWNGKGENSFFATVANWDKEPGNSANCKFAGTQRTVITNGVAEGSVRKCGNLIVLEDSGPFVFRGGKFSFCYPNDGDDWEKIYYSVRTDSPFPTVLENDITSHAAKPLGFMLQSYKEGSLALLGDCVDNIPLLFGGDVRIGGNWTASRVECCPNYGAASVTRRSRLTVMQGATLNVTAQHGELYRNAIFQVATDGVMNVAGTEFLFTTNSGTHYVDGTLAVNCPFGATVRQTFRGDGTLKLLGGFVDGKTSGGLRLEGNLTLVPSDWDAALPLSLKGAISIAPETDWTYGAETNLVLDGNSMLTLATGGHALTFASPVVSDGEIAVTGGGRLLLGAAGTKLWKVSCADGATVGATDELLAANAGADKFADILSVRRQDDSLVFADDLKTRMRYESETDTYVFSAKRKLGLMLIVR